MAARTLPLCSLACVVGCGGHPPPATPHPEPQKAATSAQPVPTVPAPATSGTLTAPKGGSEAPLGAFWGTEQPVTFVAAAPDRRWIAACQARSDTDGNGRIAVEVGVQGELRGDRLDGYFMEEPGSGIRVDAFGGADPSGRFVALVAGERLVLRDTLSRTETTLGDGAIDLRDDRGSFSRPRVVSFDPTGRRLVYLRKNGATNDVVVRELIAGAETVITPGDGELWRADFDATGEWIVLRVVTSDTNGNGRLDWPLPAAAGPSMRCAGPLPRYAAWERPGDEPTARVARVSGGPAVEAPGLIVPLGEVLVERDTEGAITLAKTSGERTTIVKKSCAGKLLHAEPARGLVVATCENKKGHSDVRFVMRGVDKSLGLELLAPAGDHWGAPDARLLPLYPGSDSVLVDLESGNVARLSSGDRVMSVAGDNALILRGRSLSLFTKGAAERTLDATVDPLAHVLRSEPVVAVPPIVVDVAKGEVIGKTDGRALAVSRDGSYLVARSSADATRIAVGPLIWEKAL